MNYFSAKQIADKWNVSPRRVQVLAAQGRIGGAKQIGGRWLIPEDAQKPADPRKHRSAPSEKPDACCVFPFPLACMRADTPISTFSTEEQQLYHLCMLYESGKFQEARELAETLLTSQTPCIRLGGLYFLAIICIYLFDYTASEVYAAQLKSEVERATEHRAELALLLTFYGSEVESISCNAGTADLSHVDAYPDDLLPLLSAMRLLADMTKFSLDAGREPDIKGYEILCRSFETQGYFYPSMLMHHYLSSYYVFVDDPEKERQHLERVAAIGMEHGIDLVLSQLMLFSPKVLPEILQSYEPAFTERIKPLFDRYKEARNRFIRYKNRADILSRMDKEDIDLTICCMKKYSVAEMAHHFGLSKSGMNRRLSKFYEKWGVSSKAEVPTSCLRALIDYGSRNPHSESMGRPSLSNVRDAN